MTRHYFTVDLEEYFQVSAFDRVVTRDAWPRMPSRLAQSVPLLLDDLARAGATATFFVLGWLARHRPDVVRDIAAAGHEIASHGFWHRRVNGLTAEAFRQDLRDSRAVLEDLTGVAVLGFRAPSFSIVRGTEWAFDVLLEEGFRYDSSVFPIRRRGYGYAGAPRTAFDIVRPAGTLREFPMATTRVAGLVLPAAGGGYMRHFPFSLVRRAFLEARAAGAPATFYIHPWEIDPGQPRMAVGALTRFRHYRGLSLVRARMRRLLEEFQFTSIASGLPTASAGTARPIPSPAGRA